MAEQRTGIIDAASQKNQVVSQADYKMTLPKEIDLFSAIYEWQPTGVRVTLSLPMTNLHNMPFFCFRDSPYWIPLNYFYYFTGTGQDRGVELWDSMRSWFVPFSTMDNDVTRAPIGEAITVEEVDTMPFISWLALHHAVSTGRISYKIRTISNFTNQGKISHSVLPNLARPVAHADWFTYRSPIPFAIDTSQERRHFTDQITDLSRDSEIDILVPYTNYYPFRKHQDYWINNKAQFKTGWPDMPFDSYVFLDSVGTVDVSAGSHQITFEILIKAEPDFILSLPMPLSYKSFRPKRTGVFDPMLFGKGAIYTTDGIAEMKPKPSRVPAQISLRKKLAKLDLNIEKLGG